MAETIGKITNIKVITVPLVAPGQFIDAAAITLSSMPTGLSWLFHLWVSHDDEPAVQRVLQSQRLALVREAAFRKLTVHVFTESDSSLVNEIIVDIS